MSGPGDEAAPREGLELLVVSTLGELAELQALLGPCYLRYSAGPAVDLGSASVDWESGCTLPGLSVNPVNPEPWWDRPALHWVARQLCQYLHLRERGRQAWVLTGTVVGRGPDCEPLVDDVVPVALVDDAVLEEALTVYRTVFTPGLR